MCGRFTLRTPAEEIAELLAELDVDLPLLRPRYNIAPTQEVLAVRVGSAGEPCADWLRWGLIPSWAKDRAIGQRMINARAESLADKPAFRTAFRRRRCLIPADGFFEWQKVGSSKQPNYITRGDGKPFCFAGLWESWNDPASSTELKSCTIITTEANAFLRPLHDRMPVILARDRFPRWLDPRVQDPAEFARDLVPWLGEPLRRQVVSPLVNQPKNDIAACIEPVE